MVGARRPTRPLVRHEQAAVRALESAPAAGRGPGEELCPEALPAVRAIHLVARVGGAAGHAATLPEPTRLADLTLDEPSKESSPAYSLRSRTGPAAPPAIR